jgi:hypothetical protein
MIYHWVKVFFLYFLKKKHYCIFSCAGFGVTSRSTNEMRAADNEAVVAFHQADIGEYLRDECDLL